MSELDLGRVVGYGLPAGGAVGQIPVKKSAANYDLDWQNPQYSRPNLLDNWCFIGGGSQLGDGVFPINQKGQTQYTRASGCIDQWEIVTGGTQVDLVSSGLKITISSSANLASLFAQALRSIQNIAGKTVTISCLVTENTTTKGVAFRTGSAQLETIIGTGLFSHTYGGYLSTYNSAGFAAIDRNADNGKYLIISAIKLEIGEYQTLAHQDTNGNWVLNELPNFGEELLKCQRYFQMFRTEALRPTYGADCRPTMAAAQPTKGTVTIDGVTYYTLTA